MKREAATRRVGAVGAAAMDHAAHVTISDPAGISAAPISSGSGTRPSGQRWLPGTMRVAPFSSVKSVTAHMVASVSGGAGFWMG